MRTEKYRNGLLTIFFVFVIACTCLLSEGTNFMIKSGYKFLTSTDLVFITILVVLALGIFIILDLKKNKTRINWYFLLFFVAMTAIGLYGIISPYVCYATTGAMPNEFYKYDPTRMASSILSLVLGNIVLYILIAVLPKRFASTRIISVIYWLCVLFGLFAMAYSFYTETKSYIEIFNPTEGAYSSIKSFFYNENNYGQVLFLCIISLLVMDIKKPHWYYVVLEIVFFIGIIFSTSVTSLIVSLIAFCGYYIYKFLGSIRKYTLRNCAILGGVFFVVLAVAMTYICFVRYSILNFDNLQEYISETILSKDLSSSSGRTDNWKMCLSSFYDPMQYVFGLGYGVSNDYIESYTLAVYNDGIRNIDSTYVQLICSYGIVGLILYLGMIATFFVLLGILVYRKRGYVAIPLIIFLSCNLIYGIFETSLLLASNSLGAYTTVLFVLPILIEYEKSKKVPSLEHSLMNDEITARKFKAGEIMMTYGLPFMIIGAGCALACLFPNYLPRKIPFTLLCLCVLFYFTFPYFMAMMRRNYGEQRFGLKCGISIGILLLFPLLAFIVVEVKMKYTLMATLAFAGLYLFEIIIFNLTFTMGKTSNIKETWGLVWHNLILNAIWPIFLVLIFFAPLTYFISIINLDFYSRTIYLVSVTLIFALSVIYFPSPTKSHKEYKDVLELLNDRILLKQKMYFVVGDRRLPDSKLVLPTQK